MDTGFLQNPLNVLIIVVGILAVVGGVGFLIFKRGLSLSKEGISVLPEQDSLQSAIPRIDMNTKTKLQEVLNNNKDAMLGILSTVADRGLQLLLLYVLLEELRSRIVINHFSWTLSDKSVLNEWIADRSKSICARLRFVEAYAQTTVDRSQLEQCIRECCEYMTDEFSAIVIAACYEKISIYQKYTSAKSRSLIEKNEGYIANIERIFRSA